MLGVLGAVSTGLGIANSLFGKKPRAVQGGASPYMGADELRRYEVLKEILRRTQSPYLANLGMRGPHDGTY